MKKMTYAAALGLLVMSAPAFADVLHFTVPLAATNEVPPTQSQGTGTLQVTYDTTTRQLTWSGTYTALTGPETMAHFHGPATKGINAGVEVPVDASKNPFEGSAVLTEAQSKDLTSGKMYFNIHTPQNRKGEIRGQIEVSP